MLGLDELVVAHRAVEKHVAALHVGLHAVLVHQDVEMGDHRGAVGSSMMVDPGCPSYFARILLSGFALIEPAKN